MEQILELVKQELANKLNKKSIKDYDQIDIDTAVDLLESEGLPVYSDLKNSLTTPWSVAKYIQLSLEEKELLERVEKDLRESIPANIETAYLKKFSCIVQLSKTFVEGEKQQVLCLKYFLDEDDKIQYKIVSNNTIWGWDISKKQLIALLKNEGFLQEKFDSKKVSIKSWFRRLLAKLGL